MSFFDHFHALISEDYLYSLEVWMGDWSFVLALGILCLELLFLAVKKSLNWDIIGDTVTNFITLFAFQAVNFVLVATFYVAAFYTVYNHFSIVQLPINGWVIFACIILADLVYYWEHRFMHRVGIGWATHTVHHSSPYFNISVAYRFGPLDGIMPFFFHLPLAVLGFNPIVILFSEAFVQIFQTLLHTERVKKFPRPIEAIFNTPSHHRVHHGSNPDYIDKNYAGIFIIWDKMFGTFAEEKEKVVFGITTPLNSINPWTVFTHGLTKLGSNVWHAKTFKDKVNYIIQPPGWEPANK